MNDVLHKENRFSEQFSRNEKQSTGDNYFAN